MQENSKNGFKDPYRYLKEEHRAIVSLMDELSGKEGGRESERSRAALWGDLRNALSSHVLLEEAALYPILSEQKPMLAPLRQAREADGRMKRLIVELESTPSRTDEWAEKFSALRTEVGRHIEEEEGRLLPLSRVALGKQGSEILMARMERHIAGIPALTHR